MTYPIDFETTTLNYQDGNRSDKFYHVMLLTRGDGIGLIIKRWGKTGSIGSFKFEKFSILKAAQKEYESIVDSKRRKGYQASNHNIKSVNSDNEIRMAIGPAIWPQIPAGSLNHILPHLDTTGRKENAPPPRFDEDGKFIGDAPARVFSQTEIKKARAAERVEEQARAEVEYAANPKFGLF